MMCKNWDTCHNRTGCPQSKKCWRNWQLCGMCAVKAHPEAYSKNYVKKITAQMK